MFVDDWDALLTARADDIEAWFAEREKAVQLPFYMSVDIRNAGYKSAVVDTNLFPAGFNNLCDYAYRLAAEQAEQYFKKNFPDARRVLLVPESNTRNPGYTANIAKLEDILHRAGKETTVGTLIESVPSSGAELEGLNGAKVTLKPFTIADGVPEVDGKPYDLVVLNHDLSGGEPPAVKQLRVPVVPRRVLGWHLRRKSRHFAHLGDINSRFGQAFGLDPWRITAVTTSVAGVSFDAPDERLREAVGSMIERVAKDYAERGVTDRPYVYVKHDAGTYGMGVMPVHDLSELDALSRDSRKKMSKGKGGVAISDVVVQEGLPTLDRVKNAYGEPVVYAVNNHIIGGFFRMHHEVNERESLNKPGQVYARLCATPRPEQSRSEECIHDARKFRVYGVLARLAGLAVVAERDELEQLP